MAQGFKIWLKRRTEASTNAETNKTFWQCAHKTVKTYRVCTHDVMIGMICCDNDTLLVTVTPRILITFTRLNHDTCFGTSDFCFFNVNKYYFLHLVQIKSEVVGSRPDCNVLKLSRASVNIESRYVSSAYLQSAVIARRSDVSVI